MRSMKEFFPSESEYPTTTASSISPIEPEVVEMPQESSTSSDDGHILNPIEDMQYSSWSAPTNIGDIDFFSAEPERAAGLIYDVEALIEQALQQDVEEFRASAAFSYFEQSLALPITSGVASFDNHQYL